MKKIILLLCFCTLICCTNDNTEVPVNEASETENPIDNLPWLKTLINEFKEDQSDLAGFFFIEIAEYSEETIFMSNNCCPICGTVVPIYNWKGESLGFLNDQIPVEKIRNSRIIFKRSDYSFQK